jgi:lipid-binding SYLF domain-containing protein
MRISTASYGALAAAVALACGALNAQEREDLSEAERAEVEQQTEALERRREQLEQQTEALEESNEAFSELEEQQGGRPDDQQEVDARREELVRTAEETLEQLREQNESAAALYEQAHGYAVFDTTKGGLIVTGAGGTGVAMEKGGTERTFMHLGQAGIGLGAGLENYRLVLLIADEQTYEDFVSGQWDGSISAQAAAGEEGIAAEEQFVEGIRSFRLTDAGLMAQADVSGVRFWVSEELNDGDVRVAEAEPAEELQQAAEEAQQRFEETAEETEEVFEETEEAVQ